MMDEDALKTCLTSLEREHRSDRDGGYDLARAIIELWDSLETNSRNLLADLLLEAAEIEQPSWWGVALEVLAKRGNRRESNALLNLFMSQTRSTEWEEQIVLTLLRIGDPVALSRYSAYIEVALQQERPFFLTALMQLFRLDQRLSIAWGSQFLTKVLSSQTGEAMIRSSMPGVVSAASLVDPELLQGIHQKIKATDAKAASRFFSLINNYLDQSWALKNIPPIAAEKVRRYFAGLQ